MINYKRFLQGLFICLVLLLGISLAIPEADAAEIPQTITEEVNVTRLPMYWRVINGRVFSCAELNTHTFCEEMPMEKLIDLMAQEKAAREAVEGITL